MIRRTAPLIVIAFLFASCISEKAMPEELGISLISIWESGDTSLVKDIFHINGQYIDMPNNHVFEGLVGAKEYISHIHTWGSDIKMEIRNTQFAGDNGYIEWTMSATQTSPIEDRVPVATNMNIEINGVTLIEMENNLIVRATDYLDALSFVLQLGSKIELPGGVVIGGSE